MHNAGTVLSPCAVRAQAHTSEFAAFLADKVVGAGTDIAKKGRAKLRDEVASSDPPGVRLSVACRWTEFDYLPYSVIHVYHSFRFARAC